MNKLMHFAIHASNADRTKQFYEDVFDWQCNSYAGAEEFYQISTSEGEVVGAISGRRYNPASKDIYGFECSISVDDVEDTINAVENAGGKTLMPKTAIPGVGWIAKFLDPDGNLFCAIKYDKSAH